jgi:hypothetical protein
VVDTDYGIVDETRPLASSADRGHAIAVAQFVLGYRRRASTTQGAACA